jgi:hypothetical protein
VGPERPLRAWHPLACQPIGDVLLKFQRRFNRLPRTQHQHARRAARWERINLRKRHSKRGQRDRAAHGVRDVAAAVFGYLTDEHERKVLMFRLDQSDPVRSVNLPERLPLDQRHRRAGSVGQLDSGKQAHGWILQLRS